MSAEPLIDLHCHVLPGMDDGSPDPDTSVRMLRRQAEQGVGVVCATSHYYAGQNDIPAFCRRRAAALEQLRAALPDGLPRVLPGAEVAFFSGISEREGLERLCIQDTRTLLLEMPFAPWSELHLEEVSALVLDRGFQVILAHPERFCGYRGNREMLRRMDQLPVSLQVNTGALLRWTSRSLGLELLREARFPLLASDCHNLDRRPPHLQEGRKVAAQRLGASILERMDQQALRLLEPALQKVSV